MTRDYPTLDLDRLRVLPLAERDSLTRADDILVPPETPPETLDPGVTNRIREAAAQIREARGRGASVMLIYGAHLLRNGAALLVDSLMAGGWITHLATNGAGTIHDWEYAYLGRSTERVGPNVATGTFGAWDETGRFIHLALLAGGIGGAGYGEALGRFIAEDGVRLPSAQELTGQIRAEPGHPLTSARADLLGAMRRFDVHSNGGWIGVDHPWKRASIMAAAFERKVPLTVHPGIGYDIISNHPWFHGAAIGRAAQVDFARFGAAVETLDHGVVLSIGSAIMGPQVFEKSLSCVNNLRLQDGRPIVSGHALYVVDIQSGGEWDWTAGEPPRDHPAYYLRFCKSYSRMGGAMHYVQCDNLAFVHSIQHVLTND